MRKLVFFLLFTVSYTFAQGDIQFMNNTSRRIQIGLVGYGTNAGYDNCGNILTANAQLTNAIEVLPNSVNLISSFGNVASWNDGSTFISGSAAQSSHGQAIWTLVRYGFRVVTSPGTSTLYTGGVRNSLCGPPELSYTSGGVTATWSTVGSTTVIIFN